MKPGDRVGRYVVEGLLGQGGMGHVYRAYDEVLHRSVALKLLRADDSEGSGGPSATVRRILREARMAAALDHPNVVAIHDVGEHEGTPFIVMELVTGRPLRAFVGADVPAAERVRWLVDVARALAAAHRKGLVHRDVKPENVLVRDDGVVKVLDFGIARLAGAGAGRPPAAIETSPAATTHDGSTIAGTPAYMAPEQIRGEVTDARADQFAWGVLGHELLRGRLPWGGEPAAFLSAVLHESPAPLDAAALGVPADVARVIERAMAKSAAARFASMDEVVTALAIATGDSLRDARRITAVPSGPSSEIASAPTERATTSAASFRELTVRPRAGPRLALVAAALGGATLVAVGAWIGLRARPAGGDPSVAPAPASKTPAPTALAFHPVEPRRLTFDPGCEEFPSLTPDGRTVVFDATFGDDSHIVAMDIATGARRVLTQGAGWQFAPALSPDGARVAYLDQSRERTVSNVVPLDGSAPPRLVRVGSARPTWSPDGRSIWAGGGGAVERVDLATDATTRKVPEPRAGHFLQVSELADGRMVALLLNPDRTGCLGLGLFASGADTATIVPMIIDETLAVTRDLAHVLVSKELPSKRVELWQVPLGGGEPSFVGDNAVQPTKGLAMAGDRVVWSTCNTDTALATLRESGAGALEAEPFFANAEWQDTFPVAIPGDDAHLLVVSDRSGRAQHWVVDASAREPPRMIDEGDVIPSESAVSPDGRWIAFAVAHAGIHVVPLDGSAPPRAVTSDEADREPTFGRDGRTLYFETQGTDGRRAIASVGLDAPSSRTVVLDRAKRPCASPAADELAYVTDETNGGVVRVLDLRTRRSAPLERDARPVRHAFVRWSPDGRRLVVASGVGELAELDARRGAVARRYTTSDEIVSATYLGARLLIARNTWRGDLWIARDASVAR